MWFYSRDLELQQVNQWVAGSSAGALLVNGPGGSGKTTLLGRLADGLNERIIRLGSCGADAGRELSGIGTLLDSVDDPRASELAQQIAVGQVRDKPRLAQAVLTILRAAFREPAVLFIDNIDRMDTTSQQIIDAVFRRTAGTGIRAVVTARATTSNGPFSRLSRVDIRPLDIELTATLVSSEAGPSCNRAVARAVAEVSGGIPGAALEMLGRLSAGQIAGKDPLQYPLRVGPVTTSAAEEALHGLSAQSHELLKYLSAAPYCPWAAIRTIDPDAVAAIGELETRGLIRGHSTRMHLHPHAVRSAVYWSMPSDERITVHRRAAEANARYPVLHAWHLSMATGFEAAEAGLMTEALKCIESGDLWTGFELASRAMLEQAACPALCHDMAAAAYACFNQNAFELARYFVDRADHPAATPAVRLQAGSLRVSLEYLSTQVVQSPVAFAALDRYGNEAPNHSAFLLSILSMYYAENWDLDSASKMLQRTEPLASHAGPDTRTVMTSARLLLSSMNGDPHTEDELHAATALETIGSIPPTALMMRARALTYSERYEDARSLFDMILSQAHQIDPLWILTTRVYSADNDMRSGYFHGATATVESLVRTDDGTQVHRPFRALLEAWFWRERGENEKATASFNRALELSRGRRAPSAFARTDAHEGALSLHQGDLPTALKLLRRAHNTCSRLTNPQISRVEPDLIEALYRSGQKDESTELLDNFRNRSRHAPSRWATLAVQRCEALHTPDSSCIEAFDAALSTHLTGDSTFERARLLTTFATRMTQLGMTARAEQLQATAADLFREAGLPLWADQAKKHHSPKSARSGARGGAYPSNDLTESEQHVADLVQAGKRNRQIAAELYLSERTVEARLTSIYRKLGVKSRAQLMAMG